MAPAPLPARKRPRRERHAQPVALVVGGAPGPWHGPTGRRDTGPATARSPRSRRTRGPPPERSTPPSRTASSPPRPRHGRSGPGAGRALRSRSGSRSRSFPCGRTSFGRARCPPGEPERSLLSETSPCCRPGFRRGTRPPPSGPARPRASSGWSGRNFRSGCARASGPPGPPSRAAGPTGNPPRCTAPRCRRSPAAVPRRPAAVAPGRATPRTRSAADRR